MKHRLAAAILLTGSLAGCSLPSFLGGDEAGPAAQPPTAPASAGAKARSSEEDGEEEGGGEYVYNPIGKRDPFRTFIATADDEEIRSPTPLQRYELEQYKLTGIVWGVDRPRALVEDPEGMGHVIELGTYIGKKWGKVTQITSSQLVVTEEYLTPDGALVVNPIEIKLQYDEEQP
ncbi:MAG: pilus assembly protein PilP [Pseudomonadota bacterium]